MQGISSSLLTMVRKAKYNGNVGYTSVPLCHAVRMAPVLYFVQIGQWGGRSEEHPTISKYCVLTRTKCKIRSSCNRGWTHML